MPTDVPEITLALDRRQGVRPLPAAVFEPIRVYQSTADGAPKRWGWRGVTRETYRVISHRHGRWRLHSSAGDVVIERCRHGLAVTGVYYYAEPPSTEGDEDLDDRVYYFAGQSGNGRS